MLNQQINNLERKINALCEVCLFLQSRIQLSYAFKTRPWCFNKVAERAERMRVLAKSVNLDMAKDVVESVKSFDVKKKREVLKDSRTSCNQTGSSSSN